MKSYTEDFFQEPFNKFIKQIEQINFYKSLIDESVETKYKQLLEQKNMKPKSWTEDDFFTGAVGLSFYNPFNGEYEHLSVYERTINKDIKSLEYHYNKQYQWLLVEAYEAYEKFLSNLYAYTGYIDNSFWTMEDFGKISLNELTNKELHWFIERSKKPNEILKQIRLKIPTLKDYEKDNRIGIDFKLHITLIEKLRHIIVHKSGETKKELFIEKMLKELGVYNNGNYNKEYDELINIYFKKDNNIDTVVLLDIQNSNNYYRHDRFSPRLNDLISYSHMLNHLILSILKDKKLIKAESLLT